MMSGLNLELLHTTVSYYWLGALSEPVPIVSREEMNQAAAGGAIVWDVRRGDEFAQGHVDGALSLGGVDWLLADNCGGNLIPAKVIQDALREAGIRPGRAVIVYAEQPAGDAFVALRALRSIGIADAKVCLGDASTVAGAVAGAVAEVAGAVGDATASRAGRPGGMGTKFAATDFFVTAS
jgi:rhodanese-related sulfurtransferase